MDELRHRHFNPAIYPRLLELAERKGLTVRKVERGNELLKKTYLTKEECEGEDVLEELADCELDAFRGHLIEHLPKHGTVINHCFSEEAHPLSQEEGMRHYTCQLGGGK